MAAVIEYAVDALTWIRWAGVAYLVYLGLRTWNEPADDLSTIQAAPAVFWKAVVIAAINPKTLLFIAAFLPQFVIVDAGISGHPASVAALFLVVLLLGDTIWAATAAFGASPARSLCACQESNHGRLSRGGGRRARVVEALKPFTL